MTVVDSRNAPLRVAVIGCGRVSRTVHYAALKANADFEFSAVCDPDSARADEWSRKTNVKAYYGMYDLLDREPLELVAINTPNGTHPHLAAKAANRGLHVLCEKPLAMRVADADALIELCDRKGVRLFSVLQNRFNA